MSFRFFGQQFGTDDDEHFRKRFLDVVYGGYCLVLIFLNGFQVPVVVTQLTT